MKVRENEIIEATVLDEQYGMDVQTEKVFLIDEITAITKVEDSNARVMLRNEEVVCVEQYSEIKDVWIKWKRRNSWTNHT